MGLRLPVVPTAPNNFFTTEPSERAEAGAWGQSVGSEASGMKVCFAARPAAFAGL